jgi:hypothetical protein
MLGFVQVLVPLLAGLLGSLWMGLRFRRIEWPVPVGAVLGA